MKFANLAGTLLAATSGADHLPGFAAALLLSWVGMRYVPTSRRWPLAALRDQCRAKKVG